jgi:hypothetical protein
MKAANISITIQCLLGYLWRGQDYTYEDMQEMGSHFAGVVYDPDLSVLHLMFTGIGEHDRAECQKITGLPSVSPKELLELLKDE